MPLLSEQQVKFSEALISFSVNQRCWIQQFKIEGSYRFIIFYIYCYRFRAFDYLQLFTPLQLLLLYHSIRQQHYLTPFNCYYT